MKIKGSYFPNEDYDFGTSSDKLVTFVEMLKARGCYIGEDWHIRSKKGGMMSKLMRNGYFLTVATYNRKHYYFCEHRVIWCWLKGAIPDGLQVNHKDYNRANNNIDNLELLTPQENLEYSAPNRNPPRGEKSSKAKFTNKQVEAIKFIAKHAGWTTKAITRFVGVCTEASMGRVVNGKRYADVVTPEDVLSVYPTIVDFTRNKAIGREEEIKNYCMGLCGELGELVDLMKKYLYHGKDVQPMDIMLEMGDVLYYAVALGNVLGMDFDLVALNNNVKLLSRYPDGFNTQASENRIEDREPHDNGVGV